MQFKPSNDFFSNTSNTIFYKSIQPFFVVFLSSVNSHASHAYSVGDSRQLIIRYMSDSCITPLSWIISLLWPPCYTLSITYWEATMMMLWFLMDDVVLFVDNQYYLEGSLDALLCGNSSDAGWVLRPQYHTRTVLEYYTHTVLEYHTHTVLENYTHILLCHYTSTPMWFALLCFDLLTLNLSF